MSRKTVDWGFPNEAVPIGSGSYYAVRFSPAPLRPQYAVVLAWYRKMRGIACAPADPGVARLKLDWWRDELHRTFEAQRPQHPMTIAMADQGIGPTAADPMHAIVDATEQLIRQPGLADIAAFHSDCAASGGRLFEIFCRLEPGSTYAVERSLALGAYWDAVERVCRLPDRPEQVTKALDPRQATGLQATARQAHCEALLRYPGGRTALRKEPVPDLARRLVAVAQGLHAHLARRGFTAIEQPTDRAPIAHLWTAWRCRGGLRGTR
ncbi:MAG: squalene/phytoene synthase family protein [Chromatiaceae bacterium]|jgi:hypothetical protein